MILDSLDKYQRKLLTQHLSLVLEANNNINLTRIESIEKGIILHIEDSLLCLPEFMEQDGLFLDIGTGGGFPGIPLAIASGRPGVLIDSVKKKAQVVAEMVHALGLDDQLTVLGVRSEDYAHKVGECFSTVITRAVSSIPSVEELATPLLTMGGNLIALRGKEDAVSIGNACNVADKLGLELTSQRYVSLDDTFDRNILVFTKVKDSSIKLPRRVGMAQKKPIS